MNVIEAARLTCEPLRGSRRSPGVSMVPKSREEAGVPPGAMDVILCCY